METRTHNLTKTTYRLWNRLDCNMDTVQTGDLKSAIQYFKDKWGEEFIDYFGCFLQYSVGEGEPYSYTNYYFFNRGRTK